MTEAEKGQFCDTVSTFPYEDSSCSQKPSYSPRYARRSHQSLLREAHHIRKPSGSLDILASFSVRQPIPLDTSPAER